MHHTGEGKRRWYLGTQAHVLPTGGWKVPASHAEIERKVSKLDDDIDAPLHATGPTLARAKQIRHATTLLGLQGFLGSRLGRPCHCNSHYELQPLPPFGHKAAERGRQIQHHENLWYYHHYIFVFRNVYISRHDFFGVMFIQHPFLHSPEMRPNKKKRGQEKPTQTDSTQTDHVRSCLDTCAHHPVLGRT